MTIVGEKLISNRGNRIVDFDATIVLIELTNRSREFLSEDISTTWLLNHSWIKRMHE